jgi:hypothetical protein
MGDQFAGCVSADTDPELRGFSRPAEEILKDQSALETGMAPGRGELLEHPVDPFRERNVPGRRPTGGSSPLHPSGESIERHEL